MYLLTFITMYDPLKDPSPGMEKPYPASYWSEHSGPPPSNSGRVIKDMQVDVAIIGSGYTGLSCALHLARDHNIKAHIIEANQTAWGCSGRNAGFILKSTGRKAYSSMISQWGNETAQGIYNEVSEGVETVNQLIADGIECDQQSNGYLRIAHKPSRIAELKAQAKLLRKEFNYQTEILSAGQIRAEYFDSKDAHGAIKFNDCYGINPLKLAWGYQKMAQKLGATIHTNSPVTEWETIANKQVLRTPQGNVTANKVIIATNGYTPNRFHFATNNRTLPVLSQIIVTKPLTEAQIEAANFITDNVVMDTRALKYYFRKLPDNRILFGGRGAISGKDADDPYFANRLLKVLSNSFPAVEELAIDYSWSGWISISLDDLPHIRQADEKGNVAYSLGYCGNGVSFAVQAGKRLAQWTAGQTLPYLPYFNTDLPKFPFAQFRRLGQWGYFHYGKVSDRWF